ncbi:alpha-amylase family glycosyl hydrolase [Altibacter sp. HG106]|uniref:alpha-amylase family glycosyl hydrolase n=1 Tax=Altibacter sp. HG106 TaxID=3023937 RepID=UPI0023500B19|nr:alpha-amylase family glycosyl hydrolase [Altibacter sp. HG106]MDC7995448.1 alpha-amylase family glycosyl hydrolase [Altibacter sp. HG106]
MKTISSFCMVWVLFFGIVACNDETKKTVETETEPQSSYTPINDSVLSNAVIYEANIRQYSPEGTFDAFTADIPKLKDLGVQIIWLMPIHPISMEKRKAQGDLMVSEIEDLEERKKYLGSYYAVADYTAVNTEYGTKTDFDKLVTTAHENGIYVILDWVPNHTGWDHPWITEHPEYYTQNEAGEIIDPLNNEGESWGWTDVADLNYDNAEMQQAMIADMQYWITEHDVDGFRCDVAHGVPQAFWEKAIPRLREEKDIFMLAEAEIPEIMTGDLFEMSYAWEGHHILNEIAKGSANVAAFDSYMKDREEKWEANDILMNFVTNHDENSWNGTVNERMGDAQDALLALTYTMPGMPLIYSGQEYDMDKRLRFFEKDTIPKEKGRVWPLLEMLGQLKTTHPALAGGKTPASYERLETSDDQHLLAFRRKSGDREVVYIANLNAQPNTFTVNASGNYTQLMTEESMEISPDLTLEFAPWQYVILSN